MDKNQFNDLSTFEQQKAIMAHRAGRTNLQCLKDVFGDKRVPFNATAFHTADGVAIFLDASPRNTQWHKPLLEVALDDATTHKLRMVGMLGTLGWELRLGGSAADVVGRAHHDADN